VITSRPEIAALFVSPSRLEEERHVVSAGHPLEALGEECRFFEGDSVSRPKRYAHRFALFVLAASLATTATAETHSIGTLGATLPAGSWERVRVDEGLGDDQFAQFARGYFMVVFEDFDLYDERAERLSLAGNRTGRDRAPHQRRARARLPGASG
jgi:hypothetical protein